MGGFVPHIPVLGPQAVDFLNVRDGGIYIDATFGAGGYTRAILAAADCHVIGIDRDRSAIALGADLVAESWRARLALARRPLLRSRRHRARLPVTRQSTVSCSISASPPCSSTPRSAASPSASTGRSTCAWAGGARARPMSSTRRASATSPTIIFVLGEERNSRAVAARHRQGARRRADRDHARARRYRRLGGAVAPGRHPSGDAHVPGAAHLRQRRTRRAGRGVASRRTHPQAARPAGRGLVPFARGPHREIVPQPVAARRAPARATRRSPNAPRRRSTR